MTQIVHQTCLPLEWPVRDYIIICDCVCDYVCNVYVTACVTAYVTYLSLVEWHVIITAFLPLTSVTLLF